MQESLDEIEPPEHVLITLYKFEWLLAGLEGKPIG